ncbi:MAG: transposase family protein [Actinomycetia bacterium]|nr:transposase family protein [Actinomycetes bacterium]
MRDLRSFGQPTRLVWRKRRWRCPAVFCAVGSWAEQHEQIPPGSHLLTTRAGRWVTVQVGRWGRSATEVADELGCDWHTVNRAAIAFGQAPIDDDPDRIPTVRALSLDET